MRIAIPNHRRRINFIVPDELDCLPCAQSGGQLLFYLVSRLYERTSIVVTTNLPSVNGAACSATHIIRGRTGQSCPRSGFGHIDQLISNTQRPVYCHNSDVKVSQIQLASLLYGAQWRSSSLAFKRPSTVRGSDRLHCLWGLGEAQAGE